MNTWTCGFCGARIPLDADDSSHVGGECVGKSNDQQEEGIPIDVESANELIRRGAIRGP